VEALAQVVEILLVDDRDENLLALEAVLASPQYRLIRTTSGQQALDYLAKNDCAVILLDVQMPVMDGFETARRIRSEPRTREIPIIFITAIHREDQYLQAGYEAGAVDFLTKPFDISALRSKVAVFVDLYLKTRKLLAQEKQISEFKLKMSDDRLRRVINHASVMLWSVDCAGIFTLCEGRGYRDLDPATLVGKNAFEVFAGNPNLCANIRRSLKGETFIGEIQQGDEWYEVHHAPLYSPEGELNGVIGVALEISIRKKAEAEMQEALHIRNEFISIASHELKTPLTPLRLQLQLLKRQAKLQSTGQIAVCDIVGKLDMAESQIVRLTRLVDDLLDVSRMSNHRLSVYREDLDLVSVIREVVERFSEQARIAGCVINLQGEATVAGRWDRMRMEQIMTNLVSNAIKYGSPKPVDILIEQKDGAVQVTVKDRGIGISAENLDRVFERFERAVEGNQFSGLGLGLYIVRQLVEAHNGRVWASSVPHEGSSFVFTMPCFPASVGNGNGLTKDLDGKTSDQTRRVY
jgi:signal transduction histidine kinase/FixJ family two-component response regulator